MTRTIDVLPFAREARHVSLSIIVATGLAACASFVTIPARDADKAPAITVNNFVVGGSGTVSQEIVTGGQPVSILLGTELMICW